MALDVLKERGIPLDRQSFNWRDLVHVPFSKRDDDAFTRGRVILMNGIELEGVRFLHSFARMNRDLRRVLAQVRRVDHHQATVVDWLNPTDQSPLEATIGYEQVATDVTVGRPTSVEHRAPEDDVRAPYDRRSPRAGARGDREPDARGAGRRGRGPASGISV
ncbi:hypothetical protein WMF16_39965 [Sorangium sp. So ce388]